MDNRIRAVIIDDEELARSDLKNLLLKFPQIEIIGEADSIRSAIELIEKTNPDLVFLDIQFPGESGFDLLEYLDIKIKVIFVTAFDQYAINAFEVNAVDYLLKPVNPKRLAHSIERLGKDIQHETKEIRKLNYNDPIFIEVNNKYHFIKVSSIIKITAAGNYSDICTSKGIKGLTLKTMKEWEIRLPVNSFVRIHRSTIINIDYVEKIEPWFNYSYSIILKGTEEPLVLSRRYVSKIKEKMT